MKNKKRSAATSDNIRLMLKKVLAASFLYQDLIAKTIKFSKAHHKQLGTIYSKPNASP